LLFLWTPVVDVKLRRRTWLVLGALATTLLLLIACQIGTTHFRLLTALLFFAGVVVALVPASCGGLMATLLSAAAQAKASGWNQAGNWDGVGLGAVAVLWLVARFSLPAAGFGRSHSRCPAGHSRLHHHGAGARCVVLDSRLRSIPKSSFGAVSRP
jgi:hypothetical protein